MPVTECSVEFGDGLMPWGAGHYKWDKWFRNREFWKWYGWLELSSEKNQKIAVFIGELMRFRKEGDHCYEYLYIPYWWHRVFMYSFLLTDVLIDDLSSVPLLWTNKKGAFRRYSLGCQNGKLLWIDWITDTLFLCWLKHSNGGTPSF
jgi:hypothetical protein